MTDIKKRPSGRGARTLQSLFNAPRSLRFSFFRLSAALFSRSLLRCWSFINSFFVRNLFFLRFAENAWQNISRAVLSSFSKRVFRQRFAFYLFALAFETLSFSAGTLKFACNIFFRDTGRNNFNVWPLDRKIEFLRSTKRKKSERKKLMLGERKWFSRNLSIPIECK